jgi:hypothetical protein
MRSHSKIGIDEPSASVNRSHDRTGLISKVSGAQPLDLIAFYEIMFNLSARTIFVCTIHLMGELNDFILFVILIFSGQQDSLFTVNQKKP